MVSFIVIAKDKKKRETYYKEYAANLQTDVFDITVIERDTASKQQSIGIETVKLMQKKLFLKPIKSAIKLLVIEEAHLLTPEAQNALLKILEEPPDNTHIILATETKEALLPTILSRCQIFELEEEKKTLSEKTYEELSQFIEELPELSLGDRLKKAEILAKDKDKAISWIETLILMLREKLLGNIILGTTEGVIPGSDSEHTPQGTGARMTNIDYTKLLKALQKLHTLLKTTNVNPRFALEQTLLNL